ncbi:S1 domain-containing post-transcriptional regulator GSP13 [Aquibacillus salsiterrae]|uniref:S1 domain-containing post-transcriptional regulator GSP13 n=1 Tax=Aquibacillus salsiterrae TaxID=2950439 RepID=A0A9X3WGN2_9BACI|nr:S1 domain-containing post-transcriptional regulator GSP13 [Aquibacillus salsiterrae]MDC3418293.1 S1 domain-containing post-transcriptional regulator GSP13 [Aquibacillus salsiterrae]
MVEKITEGQVLEGKVTGIQPYGAFVALNDEIQGLVHISEVTHGFVTDINEFLSVGDVVQVKVLSVDENKNKYSLSIRATQEPPQQQEAPKPKRPRNNQKQPVQQQSSNEAGFNTLKDKLDEWIKQSENRESIYRS